MRRVELTGHRIGSIIVLGPAGVNTNGRTLWKCRCDCGHEYITTSGVLRTAKNCKRCAAAKKIEGCHFGKLTTLSHLYDEKMRHCWICQCDCGNHVIYPQKELLRGHATTCRKCPINEFSSDNDGGIGKTATGKTFHFDLDDWYEVTKRTWHCTSKGYVVSGSKDTRVALHRMVMGAPDDMQVDHINRDKADCRKVNLRLATNALNCANAAVYSSNRSTGHKNVYAKDGRFRVVIRKRGVCHSYGYYSDLQAAISVANEKRKELFGEFAFYDDALDNFTTDSFQPLIEQPASDSFRR